MPYKVGKPTKVHSVHSTFPFWCPILLLTFTKVLPSELTTWTQLWAYIGPCGKGKTLQQYDREESVLRTGKTEIMKRLG